MINDKKNSTNKINLILLKKIGTPLINKKFGKEKLKIFLDKQLRD
jgi:3-dehydroquinate synthase/shikimate kinase/3-dehydroquinate synthase